MALKAQQHQILKAKATKALGTSLLIIPELRVLVLTKRHVGSGNEIEIHTRRVHLIMRTESIKAFSKRIRRCSVDGRNDTKMISVDQNSSVFV